MAGHLQAGGHELIIAPNRAPLPEEALKNGAVAKSSRREVAEAADIIILMVPDTPDVEEALFGENGVVEGLSAGKVVIDMSSIDPIATRAFAEKIAALGCHYVDAPVSGGELGARNASLTIMVGAEPEVFERVRPVLDLMGKNVSLIGGVGAGQTAKVANQIVVALTISAVGEALLFAHRAGVDPRKVRDALLGGFASSRVLEVHGARMIDRAFEPGFRIELHSKDLKLAIASGCALGLPLPQTALCQQLFMAAQAAGDQGLDHSALVKSLERLANHSMGDA